MPARRTEPSQPAEDLLRARLELACEATGLGLWDWDLASDALTWDERSTAMYGMTGVGRSGRIADIDERIHPEDQAGVAEALRAALAGSGVIDVEFRVVWPDGAVRWLYARGQALRDAGGATTRMIGTNLDVTDQRRTSQQRAADAQRMAGLVAVAHALGQAQDEQEVLEVVTARGAGLVGAQGVVLCLSDAGGLVRVLTTSWFDDEVRAEVAVLSTAEDLPMVDACRSGRSHFLPDAAAAAAAFPGSAALYAAARTEASAAVPLRAGSHAVGSLAVALAHAHAWREAEQRLLEALAAMTAQALERIRAREAERAAAAAVRQLAEALQRSLLTEPPQPDGLAVAVRYAPAAHEAQVGGDWYDAFTLPDGVTTLVVGDVAGHDRQAAAGMAQLRNMLRALAHALAEPPSRVVAALDRAAADLAPGLLATAVLVRCEPAPGGGALLRWSSAGHPPPLLVAPGGAVRLLASPPDLLLGMDPASPRTDHVAPAPPGSLVLLYTDGLVERRGLDLDEGLAWLVDAVGRLVARTPDLAPGDLCDALLALVAGRVEDDTALLAVRVAGGAAEEEIGAGSADAAAWHRVELPAASSAPSRARALVLQRCLAAGVAEASAEVAQLLASEVVTNAVLHGRSGAALAVRAAPDLVRVEVGDDDARLPVLRRVGQDALGGRGLAIVDALATRWGVREEAGGKVVWFELEP